MDATPSVLIWDFFGRQAQGTAAHFGKHLDEFLRRHDMQARSTTMVSEHALHCALQVEIDNATHAEAVARTLKASPRSRLGSRPSAREGAQEL